MPVASSVPVFNFRGKINTGYQGYSVLLNFYKFCKGFRNTCITLDWEHLQILDANLSAVLCGMMHKLKKENNLTFFLDTKSLTGGLSIFWRNRFAKYVLKSNKEPDDDRKSAISLKAFRVDWKFRLNRPHLSAPN